MRSLRVPLALLSVAAAYLVTAAMLHLMWVTSGAEGWIIAFQFLTGTFLVAIAAVGATSALAARSLFDRTDPLRLVWTLIVVGTVVRWIGHGIAYASRLAPPTVAVMRPPPLEQVGRMIAGPGFMLILIAALAIVIVRYKRLGGLARLTAVDWGITGGVALFALQSLWDIARWRQQAQAAPGLAYVIGWASDPLLAVLLLEAIVIHRAARAMQAAFVARCWSALAAGILLTALGDMGLWASARDLVGWPWQSLFWYIWPMAETAFALAPAWQLAARRAPKPGLLPRRPSHTVSTRRRIPTPPPTPVIDRPPSSDADIVDRVPLLPPEIAATRGPKGDQPPPRITGVVSNRIH